MAWASFLLVDRSTGNQNTHDLFWQQWVPQTPLCACKASGDTAPNSQSNHPKCLLNVLGLAKAKGSEKGSEKGLDWVLACQSSRHLYCMS